MKTALAKRIRSMCDGSYGDVALILTATISALAAGIWPGKRNDRARFVQLCIESDPTTKMISIPCLIEGFPPKNRSEHFKHFVDEFSRAHHPSEVLKGSQVDTDESTFVTNLLAGKHISKKQSVKKARSFSYASLLYTEIRCGYSHCYRIGAHASQFNMTQSAEHGISYDNISDDCVNGILVNPRRLICMRVEWIEALCMSAGSKCDRNVSQYEVKDDDWWINGSDQNMLPY